MGAPPKLFYGWYIVIAHIAMHFYMAVVFVYGMGVFLGPMTTQMGWTRAQFSFAAGLQRLEGSVTTPIIGFVVDNIGSRAVVACGVILTFMGLVFLSQVDSLITFYGAFLVISLGMSASIGIPFSAAAAKWFRRKRGRAMGLMFVGATFSGLFVPLVVLGIDLLGWRLAILLCSLGVLAIGIPAIFVIRSDPESYGYFPDGDSNSSYLEESMSTATLTTSSTYGLTIWEALHTQAFWLLTAIFGVLSMAPSAMFLHQVPYFESIGFSPAAAATTVGSFTLLSGIGRLGTGWLMDYVDRRLVLAILAALTVVGFIVLMFTTEYWHTLVYALVFGVAFGGSIPARPILTSEYFGTRAFGSITGLMQSLAVVGGVIAPVLMGWVFDTTGTYKPAVLGLTAAIACAIPLALFLPKPQPLLDTRT